MPLTPTSPGRLHNDDQIRRFSTPASGGRTAAHLQAGAAAEARRRSVHRHPHAADHAQEPGRFAHRPAQPRAGCRGQPIDGLYCVGEAAGFGGGGASGKRSLEGTFLPGCILTARAAARSIA
jgi:uncharacterized protein